MTAAPSATTAECPTANQNPTVTVRFSLLNELASDVIDRCYVVRIDRVAQAEAVSNQSGAQQDGRFAKQHDRP
jgi:hypothetical protein